MYFVTGMFGGKRMARKIFRIVCGIVSFLGFMLVLGTAGSSDLGLIDFPQIIWQSCIGLAMFAGGAYLGGYMI